MNFAKTDRQFQSRTATGFLPMQVAKAYHVPQGLDLSHRTMAIIELGGIARTNHVLAYCARHEIKPPRSIEDIFLDGATATSDPNGADGECGLDYCVAVGIAQGLKLKGIYGQNTEQAFVDCVAKALALDVDAVSISWGAPESKWSADARVAMDKLFLAAEQKGINVFCASGDGGSKDGNWFVNETDYPACSPYVFACGGTHLELDEQGERALETGWSHSGGGLSKLYQTPDWQGRAAQGQGRNSPDVSGNADPNTGWIVDVDGTEQQVGGTSAVAPAMAAIQVVINEAMGAHVGNMHTKLYHPEVAPLFFDVTQGSNGGYECKPGYDCVTGLGVLDVEKFVAKLKA